MNGKTVKDTGVIGSVESFCHKLKYGSHTVSIVECHEYFFIKVDGVSLYNQQINMEKAKRTSTAPVTSSTPKVSPRNQLKGLLDTEASWNAQRASPESPGRRHRMDGSASPKKKLIKLSQMDFRSLQDIPCEDQKNSNSLWGASRTKLMI